MSDKKGIVFGKRKTKTIGLENIKNFSAILWDMIKGFVTDEEEHAYTLQVVIKANKIVNGCHIRRIQVQMLDKKRTETRTQKQDSNPLILPEDYEF